MGRLRAACVLTTAALAASGYRSAAIADEVVIMAAEARVLLAEAGLAVEDDNDTPQQAALRRQLEPLLKTELSFANRACRWTPEERGKAIAAAKNWLREFARANANNNAMMNRGMMIFAGNRGPVNRGPAPEKDLRDALEKEMTVEHRRRYWTERAKLESFRTAAIIDNIVCQIDRRLNLTPEQRDKIRNSLTTNWSEDWAPPLELFVQMSEYMPAFPDEHVMPHLTREQFVAWQGIQKISARGVAFGGGLLGGNAQPIDDIDLNEAK